MFTKENSSLVKKEPPLLKGKNNIGEKQITIGKKGHRW